jgi:hypothetical protein
MDSSKVLSWSSSMSNIAPARLTQMQSEHMKRSTSCLSLINPSLVSPLPLSISPKPLLKSTSTTSLLLREPPKEFIGARVVRGPNWKWGKQDGL